MTMMIRKTITKLLLVTTLAVIISTCVDPFNPDLSDIASENELVVEGFITDAEGPQKITLTRTVPVGSSETSVPKESGATVQVIDQDGNTHTLTETKPGIYLTDESEFRGQVGNSYQLRIELSDGEIYESDLQELLPVEPIDSLWYLRGTVEVVEGTFVRDVEVVKFFTNYDTHDEPGYYRYEHFGTYAFVSELQGSSICWRNQQDVPEGLDSASVCYLDRIVDLPLNISTYPDPVTGATGFEEVFNIPFDIRFKLGYSVQVKKYALTKEYYDYLSAVREQGEYGGSIFDSPPTQIVGNIRNVNDPRRFALGYFSTLALTTKRIFVYPLGAQSLEDRCAFDPMASPPDDIPKFTDCCDCRQREGAFTERPSFWQD